MLCHYICTKCKKGFKRDINASEICPQCGEKMYGVNTDFRVPKRTNKKQWKSVEKMLRCGLRFKRWWQK